MLTTTSQPLRVWLAPSAFAPSTGGVEELTLQLAKEYSRLGHEVMVVVHRHPSHLAERDTVEGVEVRRISLDLPGSIPRSLLRYPLTLRRQLAAVEAIQPRPDLVHIQCAANQVVPLALWCRWRQVPLVLTTQGEVTMDANAIYDRSIQMRWSLRLGSRLASLLTACSQRAADDAARIAPAFANAIVIPNGVDPDNWEVTSLPAQPTFAAWGRHVPQKGFDLLIRAFAEVRRHLPDAVLRIGGAGPETPALEELAGDGVEFLGNLDRSGVQALLDRSRVAVVPSRLEPFGIVAVEAMATGRGVVWSTNGGLADATGGIGAGVDPNDVESFADALLELHTRPVDPSTARAHAETLSWGRIGARYLDCYRAVLRGRPRRERAA